MQPADRQGMRRYDFQLREEIADQIRALKGMKVMAASSTAMTFPSLQRMQEKQSSGCISDIWQQSRLRTVQQ